MLTSIINVINDSQYENVMMKYDQQRDYTILALEYRKQVQLCFMDKENVHFQRQCQQKSLFSKTMAQKKRFFYQGQMENE